MKISRRTSFLVAGAVAGLGIIAALGLPARAGPPIRGAMADFTPIEPPRPAPQTPFGTAEGGTLTFDNFKGKVLLVNLWATWCAPCVQEMPSLSNLQDTLGGEDFQVLAISTDRGGLKQVQPFYDKLGIRNLPVYLDPKTELTRALGAKGLPTSILIDRSGKMVGQLVGDAHWDSPDALALIRHYIGQPAPASLQRAAAE